MSILKKFTPVFFVLTMLVTLIIVPARLGAGVHFYLMWYVVPSLGIFAFIILFAAALAFLAQLKEERVVEGNKVVLPRGGIFGPRPNKVHAAVRNNSYTHFITADKNISTPYNPETKRWEVIDRPDGTWDRPLGNKVNELLFRITGYKFFGVPILDTIGTLKLYYPEDEVSLYDENRQKVGVQTVGITIRKRRNLNDQHVQGNVIDGIDCKHTYSIVVPVDFKGQSCFLTVLVDTIVRLPLEFYLRDGKGLETLYEAVQGKLSTYTRPIDFNDFLDDVILVSKLSPKEVEELKITDDEKNNGRANRTGYYARKFVSLVLSLNESATVRQSKVTSEGGSDTPITRPLAELMGYDIDSATYQNMTGDPVTQKLIDAQTREQTADREIRIAKQRGEAYKTELELKTQADENRIKKLFGARTENLKSIDPSVAAAIATAEGISSFTGDTLAVNTTVNPSIPLTTHSPANTVSGNTQPPTTT